MTENLYFTKITEYESSLDPMHQIFSYQENMERAYLKNDREIGHKLQIIIDIHEKFDLPSFFVYNSADITTSSVIGIVGISLAHTYVNDYYNLCPAARASKIYDFHGEEHVPIISAYVIPLYDNLEKYGIDMVAKIIAILKDSREDERYLAITRTDDTKDVMYVANKAGVFSSQVTIYVPDYKTDQTFSYVSVHN